MSAVIDLARVVRMSETTEYENSNFSAGFQKPNARGCVWYLATPYSVTTPYTKAKDAEVLAMRALLATRMAGQLIAGGLNVYSPIAAHHPASAFIASEQMPDHAGWMDICYAMLDRCDGVIVSTMDGYYGSKGVRLEIERWIERDGKQRLLFASPIRENEPWVPRFSWQATKVETL